MATITITRSDLEAAIPVATTKNDNVYEMLLPYINEAAAWVERNILGSVGVAHYAQYVQEQTAPAAEEEGTCTELQTLVKKVVCFRAFLPNFRSLDVVLTATGFGVVSTQDTAPASKMRTDALKSQLDIEAKRSECELLRELFKVEGWNKQPLRHLLVPTLFWHFDFLGSYAGKESPIINDWRLAQPLVMEADAFIRKHIGEPMMDHLLDALTSDTMTEPEQKVSALIIQLIGMYVAGNNKGFKMFLHRLLNTMEGSIDDYPLYKDSEAYQFNHFQGYENTKDSGMFIFQG